MTLCDHPRVQFCNIIITAIFNNIYMPSHSSRHQRRSHIVNNTNLIILARPFNLDPLAHVEKKRIFLSASKWDVAKFRRKNRCEQI